MKKQNPKKQEDKSSLSSIKTNLSASGKMLERISVAVADGLIDKKVYDQTEKKIAMDLLNTYVIKKRADFLKSQKSDRGSIDLKKSLMVDAKEMLKKSSKRVRISKKKILERKKQLLDEKDRRILSDIPVLRDMYLRNIISKKDYLVAIESIEKEHEKINKQLYDSLREEDLEKLKRKINSLIHRHLKKSLLKKETDELAKELSNMEVLFENKIISQELYVSKCCLIRSKINIYNDLISRINVVFNLYSKIVDSVQKKQSDGNKIKKVQNQSRENLQEEKKRVIAKINELTAD